MCDIGPRDRRAKETAIEAAALAEAAHLTKLSATEEWASYAMKLHGLLAMADEIKTFIKEDDTVLKAKPEK